MTKLRGNLSFSKITKDPKDLTKVLISFETSYLSIYLIYLVKTVLSHQPRNAFLQDFVELRSYCMLRLCRP